MHTQRKVNEQVLPEVGEQSLRQAAYFNKLENIKKILSANCNINDAHPNSLRTALHWAVIRNNLSCAKLLLENGANISLKDIRGKTALDYVLEKNDDDMLLCFRSYSKRIKLFLHEKIANFAIQFIEKKFPLGGLNRQDISEKTPRLIYLTQLTIFSNVRALYSKGKLNKAQEIFNTELDGANCGELSMRAIREIETKYPTIRMRLVSTPVHEAIVIGNKKVFKPDTILEECGECAIFCDIWAKQKHHVKEFLKIKDQLPNIPFFKSIKTENEKLVFTLSEEHYLSGNFKLVSNKDRF